MRLFLDIRVLNIVVVTLLLLIFTLDWLNSCSWFVISSRVLPTSLLMYWYICFQRPSYAETVWPAWRRGRPSGLERAQILFRLGFFIFCPSILYSTVELRHSMYPSNNHNIQYCTYYWYPLSNTRVSGHERLLLAFLGGGFSLSIAPSLYSKSCTFPTPNHHTYPRIPMRSFRTLAFCFPRSTNVPKRKHHPKHAQRIDCRCKPPS